MSDEKKPGAFYRLCGALFMRDKGSNGTASREVSNHKVFGTATLVIAVGLVIAGRHVPWEMWAITAAFLGVAVAKAALGPRR